MHRTTFTAIAAAFALAALPTAAAARDMTFTQHGVKTHYEMVDLGAPGPSAGDVHVGTFDLARTRGGTVVGTQEWMGTTIKANMPGGVEYRSADTTFTWRDGSVSATGLFESESGVLPKGHRTTTLVVVGGTGRYFGARGAVTIKVVNANERTFRFSLIDVKGTKDAQPVPLDM